MKTKLYLFDPKSIADSGDDIKALSKDYLEITKSDSHDYNSISIRVTSDSGDRGGDLGWDSIDKVTFEDVINHDEIHVVGSKEIQDGFEGKFPNKIVRGVTPSEFWRPMNTSQVAVENSTGGRVVRRYIRNGRLPAIVGKKRRGHIVQRNDWERTRRNIRPYKRK